MSGCDCIRNLWPTHNELYIVPFIGDLSATSRYSK
jgi:hypothetical protein